MYHYTTEAIAECGYAPGTVPPFGHRREMRIFVDEKVPLVPGVGLCTS